MRLARRRPAGRARLSSGQCSACMDLAARLQSSQGCSTSPRASTEPHRPAQHRARQRARARSAAKELRRAAAAVLAASLSEQQPGTGLAGSNGKAQGGPETEFVAETLLPTRYGNFRVRAYRHQWAGASQPVQQFTEPLCIITGQPEHMEEVPVRVHDACLTSEVLGSLKCDCADQLAMSMEYIQDHGPGVILYLQQEGRGIGLANKIAAYALQERGLDTVDANRALGLPDDCREYSSVRAILADLDIKSVKLLTNNPRKIRGLEALGVRVTARIPCIVPAQKFNLGYMSTKQSRMAHWLDPKGPLDGQFCHWNHDGEALLRLDGADKPLHKEVPLGDGTFKIVDPEE